MENKYLIGTDIGGTTFSSALFNDKYELELISPKNNISEFNTTKELLNGLISQIKKLAGDNLIKGIGFACPGPLKANEGIILNTPNLTLLQNCHLKKIMEEKLQIPCLIENDANLFALGEFHKSGKKICIGVTLGTGLGFGIIINEHLFLGGNGMAGEYGISPIGKEIWENNISIGGLKKLSFKYFHTIINPIELYELANQHDKNAISVWMDFGEKLGECLSHIINFIDPNAISIGGGLSHAFPFFENSMQETISNYSPSFNVNNIDVFESKQKELAAKLGAVKLFEL